MKWYKKHSLLITILLSGLVLFGGVMTLLIIEQHNQKIEADKIAKYVPPKPPKPKSKYEVGPPDPQEMLELVNAERVKVGVAPLVINENVQKSAQLKADDMVARDYFSHYMPDTGKVLNPEMDKLLSQECVDSGENFFGGPSATSEDAVNWWKESGPHYLAMVDPKYTETGFGTASNDRNIAVQHFCVAK